MNKNTRTSNILLIFGCVFLVAGYFFAFAFLTNLIKYFVMGNTLQAGLGVAFGIIILWIPALVISIISFILNLIAYKKANRPRALGRKMLFILSIILPIICAIEYIITYFL